jgi:hypothetical protein
MVSCFFYEEFLSLITLLRLKDYVVNKKRWICVAVRC